MTDHTPLPSDIKVARNVFGDLYLHSGGASVARLYTDKKTALEIAKACNLFPELVEYLEGLRDIFKDKLCPQLKDGIDRALAKAKDEAKV